MKTLFTFFVALTVPLVSLLAETPIRIGLILPLSGPGAVWGLHLRQGAELAAEKSGHVQLRFEDDHLDATAAVSAYRKLAASGGLDAIVVFGAQSAHAVVPLAERDGVLSLVITSDPDPVSGTQLAVRLALDPFPQANLLGEYLHGAGARRIALVGTTHDAMLEYLSAFKAVSAERAIKIVFEEDYAKGEVDFRTQIERILATRPDAVLSSLLPPSFSAFAKQFRQRSSSIPLLGFAQSENLSEIQAADGALESLLFAGVQLDKQFVTRYSSRFGDDPQSYACYSHDLVTMLAMSFSGSAKIAAQRLRALSDYSGACGRYSSSQGFSFGLSARLLVVRDGAIGEYVP